MAKVHFIIDPLETRVGSRWPYEQKKIEEVFKDFEIHIVRGRAHAEHLTHYACRQKAELIVCVGGDSTLHEVVNALHYYGDSAPPLTVYPEFQRGSFSKSLIWRPTFLEFLEAFLRSEAQEFFADLGEVEYAGEFGQRIRRIFISSFGFGFSSYLLHRLRHQNHIRLNRFQFLRLLSRSLPFYRIPRIKIFADSEEIPAQPILTGFVQNTTFYRESLRLSPEAQVNDGIFEFIRVDRAPILQYMLGALPFYSGKTLGFKFIRRSQLKNLRVDALHLNRQIRIDFDGKSRGYLPAEVQVLERKLRILK